MQMRVTRKCVLDMTASVLRCLNSGAPPTLATPTALTNRGQSSIFALLITNGQKLRGAGAGVT